MLRRGDSIGVFQLEGGPMRSLMRSLAPTGFDDVAALVALYRPGPMAANMHKDYADRKNGRQAVSYLHPDLEPILGDTYGLMIYQESVMRVAQRFAGYTLEEADNLRKACGKKIRALIQAEREKFVAGCVTQGYEKMLGTKLFDIIEPFADYAFNKSHSYGYGLVAYQTAWLKAHYPVEYLAALLTSVKDDKDRTAVYLGECRTLGIEVLVPDVNRSAAEFTPLVGRGRRASRSCSAWRPCATSGRASSSASWPSARRTARSSTSTTSAGASTPWCSTSGRWSRSSRPGAFDSLGVPPARAVPRLRGDRRPDPRAPPRGAGRDLDACSRRSRASATPTPGAAPVGYGDARVPIPDTEFAKTQRLAFEKEMLGLYVSDHPLRGVEAALARLTDCSIADLKELDDGPADGSGRDGQVRTVGGVVTGLVRRYTKRGELMATFVLEDLRASIEVFVFPKVMHEIGAVLADDAVFVVRGRVDTRDDQVKLVCMEAHRPELAADGVGELRVELPLGVLTDAVVDRLKQLLSEHPGDEPVFLHVGQTVLRLPGRIQRGQPAGPARGAADAARPECHRGLSDRSPEASPTGAAQPPPEARVGQGSPRPVSWWVPPSRRGPWPCHRPSRSQGRRSSWTSTEQAMPFEVGTKDCTALSDAELAEMADLCVDREPGFDIGFLSKQCEEWVLVTLVREGSKLRGYSFSTLERIGGTPSLLVGVATVDRTVKAEQAMRLLLGDQYRRALLAFPDEDVLVGTRLASCEGYQAFAGLADVVPRPGHKASGEERAWGRRLAKRFGAEGRIDDRTFVLAGDGSTAGALDLGGPKVRVPSDERGGTLRGPEPQARRPPGGLRMGHGRGPGLGSPRRGQDRPPLTPGGAAPGEARVRPRLRSTVSSANAPSGAGQEGGHGLVAVAVAWPAQRRPRGTGDGSRARLRGPCPTGGPGGPSRARRWPGGPPPGASCRCGAS